MRTPTPDRGWGGDPVLAQTAERDAVDLDWAICQLQREHARVFRTIARLRVAVNRIRTAAAR